MAEEGTFRDRVRKVYDEQGPRAAYPWIGERYVAPDAGDFRVLVIGINSYVTEAESLASSDPTWWSGWFDEETWNFPRVAWAEAGELGAALAGRGVFRGTSWSGTKDSVYATNLIKTYLGGEFVDAAKVGVKELVAGAKATAREIDLMGRHGCLPHVVVVYGRRIWDHVWPLFCPEMPQFPAYAHTRVTDYVNLDDESTLFHHANRVRYERENGVHDMLLFGLAHPARRMKSSKTATWLLGQPELRTLADLDRNSG